MTLSEDFNFEGGEFEEAEAGSSYPVIFGITFTPKISGILLALLGIAGSAYMVMNMVMPAWEAFQQQQTKETELKGQIQQKQSSINQIGKVKQELAEAKIQKAQVLGLFSNEKTLDTLLLDLNRLVESGNDLLPANAVKAKMKKFTPDAQRSELVTDGALGVAVNGKLKRAKVNVEISGTYKQTQAILRNIERLQPLLLVKEYQSTIQPEEALDAAGKKIRRTGDAPITTSFQLQALMPLSPEEVAAAAQAAAAAAASSAPAAAEKK
jgi:type IV pilus assembly protein PilO